MLFHSASLIPSMKSIDLKHLITSKCNLQSHKWLQLIITLNSFQVGNYAFFFPWEWTNSKLVFHWSKQTVTLSICNKAKKKKDVDKQNMGFSVTLSTFLIPCGHIGLMKGTCFTTTSWQYACLKKFRNNYSNWVTECTRGAREGNNIFAAVYFLFQQHILFLCLKRMYKGQQS